MATARFKNFMSRLQDRILLSFLSEIPPERKQEEERQRRIEEKKTLPLEDLLDRGYVSASEARRIERLSAACRKANGINPDKYNVSEDGLTIHFGRHGGKPHCMSFTVTCNLRLSEDRTILQEMATYSLAEKILFFATADNHSPHHKSTKTTFAREDLEADLSILEVFDDPYP